MIHFDEVDFSDWHSKEVMFLLTLCVLSRALLYKNPNALKGKFPQTTMWIGWVESNFTNPTVKVWGDLDNPFKRSDYAKLCTYFFHNFQFFLDINSPFDQVHS